jgi:hypothetical protein
MAKTVLDKLGYKPGAKARVLEAPAGLEPVLGVTLAGRATAPDWVLAFAASVAALEAIAPKAVRLYCRGGHLWFAYPKKTGAIKTDISRDHGWQVLKPFDLLPVTQIAIDDTWSALRFRYRDEIETLTRKSEG